MKHFDDAPMTPEKAIKIRAHEFIMRMHNAGVPWAHANVAALVMAIELRKQFIKFGMRPNDTKHNERMLKSFDLLEEGIKGYLPLPKESPEPCPTCGAPCSVELSGLHLVEATGDETLASKNFKYTGK
jgi:hypothetical protein